MVSAPQDTPFHTLSNPPTCAAIQLAKLSGFSPIITTVSPHNTDFVKSLGATHTIDRRLSPSEIVAEVKKITSEPLKLVYDAISLAPTQQAAFDILAPGGFLLLVLPSQIPEEKITGDTKVITTFGSVHEPENTPLGIDLYNHVTDIFASGDIKVCAPIYTYVLLLIPKLSSRTPWRYCQVDSRVSLKDWKG